MNARCQRLSCCGLLLVILWASLALLFSTGCDSSGAAKTPPNDTPANVTQDPNASPVEQSTDGSAESATKATNESPAKVDASTKAVSIRKPAELVSFDDLNLGMPVDMKFRPLMLQYNDGKVKEHFGRRIIVAGYMDSTDVMRGVKEFILLRNLECKFGPGGQADHLVRVYMAKDEATAFTDKIVYVEGELTLNPFPADPQEPITWSIYDMVDAKVSTVKPRRR